MNCRARHWLPDFRRFSVSVDKVTHAGLGDNFELSGHDAGASPKPGWTACICRIGIDFDVPSSAVSPVDNSVRNPGFVRDNWILFIASLRRLAAVDKPEAESVPYNQVWPFGTS